LQIFLATQ